MGRAWHGVHDSTDRLSEIATDLADAILEVNNANADGIRLGRTFYAHHPSERWPLRQHA